MRFTDALMRLTLAAESGTRGIHPQLAIVARSDLQELLNAFEDTDRLLRQREEPRL